MVEMVFPQQTNHYGTLYGGEALSLMDRAAFIAATRHVRKSLVTVSTDQITFHQPVKQGDMVELVARVIATGRSSVTVEVELFSEALLSGERALCTRGRFVLVAVDSQGKPVAHRPETVSL